MYRRRLLALASGSFGFLAGCATVPGPNDAGEPFDRHVEIVEDVLVRDHVGTDRERVFVLGVAERVTERELSYVEIRTRFLDEDGELLDSTVEVIDDVTEGERWVFDVEYPHYGERAAQVDDYELDVGTSL